jgi:hypothetical protein
MQRLNTPEAAEKPMTHAESVAAGKLGAAMGYHFGGEHGANPSEAQAKADHKACGRHNT